MKFKLPNAFQEAIEAIKEDLKAEIMQKIEDYLFHQEELCRLVAMAPAETVENYNRRDNIRLLGVKESARQNDEGILVGEKDSETIEKVIDVASCMGVTLYERYFHCS